MRQALTLLITSLDLRFREWVSRPKYDDLGYCWHKLGQLPDVMITLQSVSPSTRAASIRY